MTNTLKYIITFQLGHQKDLEWAYTGGSDREAYSHYGLNLSADETYNSLVKQGALEYADYPDQETMDGVKADMVERYPDVDPWGFTVHPSDGDVYHGV